MKTSCTKSKWLFNFSSSPVGGGLKRLKETAKWFDKQNGAMFIVNVRALQHVSQYSKRNRFISIKRNNIGRLVADGKYLRKIIDEINVPDVYFSYGIPVFYSVGRINWLHISNVLTLTTESFNIPLMRRFELRVLGRRIVQSIRHVQIASAESKFSLEHLRNAVRNKDALCTYITLKNGCENALFRTDTTQPRNKNTENYAITIGTAPYKHLELALAAFHKLQRSNPDMKKFKIIGDKKSIPKEVMKDSAVEAIGLVFKSELLYNMLRGAKYYISASRIENSSTAALEGLLLSQNTVLSDIPSHREIAQNLSVEKMEVPGDGIFIVIDGDKNKSLIKPPSWDDVLCKMVDIAEKHTPATSYTPSN